MAKNYLTPELIKIVEHQSASINWQMGILASSTERWYDVITVTPAGLIFIQGNEYTGWKHILSRHNYYSDKTYFGSGAVGNPSKFNGSMIPIFDLRDVADDIYSLGEKDLKPHPDTEHFEKYKGQSERYTKSAGKSVQFHLVLYKGTKIVHSLYPSKTIGEKRPKRILEHLAQSRRGVRIIYESNKNYLRVGIPYINPIGVIRYEIILVIDCETLRGRVFVQVNDLNGILWFSTYPEICGFEVNTTIPEPFRKIPDEFIDSLNNTDFSNIELIIKEIEEIQFEKPQ